MKTKEMYYKKLKTVLIEKWLIILMYQETTMEIDFYQNCVAHRDSIYVFRFFFTNHVNASACIMINVLEKIECVD